MSYKRVSPTPVIEGGTGAQTLTGVLTGNGTGSITANAVTQFGTVIAGASNALSSVAPSVTIGVPLISQGAAANPIYGTVVVAGGGTGVTTLTGVLTGNGTGAITANTVTQFGTVIAGASNALSSVAPSVTIGVPLISQGAAANPIYGTVVVAGGGTGVTTMTTAFAPVCAGTTATGSLQVASTGISTSGNVLTSTGASSLPTWQVPAGGGFASIVSRVFTSSGTYTPTAGMKFCIVEALGGGAAGGGTAGAGNHGAGGGGAGGYCRKVISAADIGASQVVTIGAGGVGVVNTTGGNGGNTTFGAILTANRGLGGLPSTSSGVGARGGDGGTATGGDVNVTGQLGDNGFAATGASTPYMGGNGANTMYGSGGFGGYLAVNRGDGTLYGSGGGGIGSNGASGVGGGLGTAGIVIVTEYI